MIQDSSVEVAALSMALLLVTACNHYGHPLTLTIPELSTIPELDQGVPHLNDRLLLLWLAQNDMVMSCPRQSAVCVCDMGMEGDFTINGP
jgi:hypothetical protein